MQVYRNDSGQFTTLVAELACEVDNVAKWGDYDNDGDLDIVSVGGMQSFVIPSPNPVAARVYLNTNGAFFEYVSDLMGTFDAAYSHPAIGPGRDVRLGISIQKEKSKTEGKCKGVVSNGGKECVGVCVVNC